MTFEMLIICLFCFISLCQVLFICLFVTLNISLFKVKINRKRNYFLLKLLPAVSNNKN